ncbi:MAG TPA: DNA-binding protein [Nitrospiria bacterium]|nr:DNA-binding protein [Nitrospiria bacterium]
MKRIGVLSATVFTLVLLFSVNDSSAARGMKWRGSGGWGPGTPYSKMYDPKTVETLSGEVVGIDRVTPMKGMSYGVHLTLKTDQETISVHLGPAWFVENQDIKIEPKDKIEVKGSKITFNGKPAVIAEEVKKGDEMLTLRDEYGYPVWSGMRRK